MEMFERGLQAQAWSASAIVHGTAVMLAIWLAAEMKPHAPQEVFRWDVSVAEAVPERQADQKTQRAQPPASAPTPQRMPPAVTSTSAVLHKHQSRPADSVAVDPQPSSSMTQVHQHPVADQGVLNSAESYAPEEITSSTVLPEPTVQVPVKEMMEAEPPIVTQEPASSLVASLPQTKTEPADHILDNAEAASEKIVPSPVPLESVALPTAAVPRTRPSPVDYRWLIDSIGSRLMELKQYPLVARSNGIEGKVLLRAVIQADGQVVDVRVQKSSGYEELDLAAIETMQRASPFRLSHELGRTQIAVTIPLVYTLAR